jgi:hypothetical protein
MAKSPTVKFPKYAPDLNEPGDDYSAVIQNVYPSVAGYAPSPMLVAFTSALPSACRGYFYGRNPDSSISIFAGTVTDLYVLNNTTFTWTKLSKSGGPYAALNSSSNWAFIQFEATIIAVQGNCNPQSLALPVVGNFADLAGTPPAAGCIAAINGFVVLSELTGNVQRVQWSDLYGITTWTAGVGYSDFQDLPDGGAVHGLSGGDNYGLVFQDLCIRSFIYAPGQAVVFDIVRIAANDPLYAKYSIINTGEKTFYISAQGVKRIDPGGYPVQIGKGRVDDFLKADIDSGNLQLVQGSADPSQTRVYWAYKSVSGQAGLTDKILVYDWSIGELGEFSLILQSAMSIASLARPGLTLDSLDAIAPTPLPITGAANNGSGNVRLTLAGGLFNSSFTVAGQNFIEVYGVGGTTEANSAIPNTANGNWKLQAGTGNPSAGFFTIVNPTTIDLGVAFVHAYTSGGFIGGSLDALSFSLDSIALAAVATISAFNSSGQLGFFTGVNMDAILETEEFDLEGDTVFCDTIRPITDCSAGLVSVVTRQSAQAPRIISTPSPLDANGLAGIVQEGRYMRGRLELPAGSTWTYAKGLQPTFQPAGEV